MRCVVASPRLLVRLAPAAHSNGAAATLRHDARRAMLHARRNDRCHRRITATVVIFVALRRYPHLAISVAAIVNTYFRAISRAFALKLPSSRRARAQLLSDRAILLARAVPRAPLPSAQRRGPRSTSARQAALRPKAPPRLTALRLDTPPPQRVRLRYNCRFTPRPPLRTPNTSTRGPPHPPPLPPRPPPPPPRPPCRRPTRRPTRRRRCRRPRTAPPRAWRGSRPSGSRSARTGPRPTAKKGGGEGETRAAADAVRIARRRKPISPCARSTPPPARATDITLLWHALASPRLPPQTRARTPHLLQRQANVRGVADPAGERAAQLAVRRASLRARARARSASTTARLCSALLARLRSRSSLSLSVSLARAALAARGSP